MQLKCHYCPGCWLSWQLRNPSWQLARTGLGSGQPGLPGRLSKYVPPARLAPPPSLPSPRQAPPALQRPSLPGIAAAAPEFIVNATAQSCQSAGCSTVSAVASSSSFDHPLSENISSRYCSSCAHVHAQCKCNIRCLPISLFLTSGWHSFRRLLCREDHVFQRLHQLRPCPCLVYMQHHMLVDQLLPHHSLLLLSPAAM